MTVQKFRIALCVLMAAVCANLAPAAQAQGIVALVNGEPITNLDVEQRTKLIQLSSRKSPDRKEVIEDLINDKVKIREAKKFGLDLSASDVDNAFAQMSTRMRLSPDQLARQLQSAGIRPETLKARIKADLVWNQLVRGRFSQSLVVGEKEILAAADSKDGKEGESHFDYRLLPVVLIVPRGAAASTIEARKREAETLRGRVQSCEQANDLFRSISSAAVRDYVTKSSADLPAPLRAILDKTPIGHLTAPEVTRQGIEMFGLCERKPGTGDTPAKRAAREKLFAEKFEARASKYLQDARRSMMVEYR